MLFQLTNCTLVEQTSFLWYANIQFTICPTEIANVFLRICRPAKCCTYAVPVNIAQLFNKPFLFSQTFTPWSYFFWGGASFFKTFMLTLNTSLKFQVFLPKRGPPKRCTYAVPVNIAHLFKKPFLFAMQTFKSLYASLKLQVCFLLNGGLAKCCTYPVKVDIAHSLNKLFLMSMQTLKSLYASLKLQVFFLLICAKLWPSELLHLCCSS